MSPSRSHSFPLVSPPGIVDAYLVRACATARPLNVTRSGVCDVGIRGERDREREAREGPFLWAVELSREASALWVRGIHSLISGNAAVRPPDLVPGVGGEARPMKTLLSSTSSRRRARPPRRERSVASKKRKREFKESTGLPVRGPEDSLISNSGVSRVARRAPFHRASSCCRLSR